MDFSFEPGDTVTLTRGVGEGTRTGLTGVLHKWSGGDGCVVFEGLPHGFYAGSEGHGPGHYYVSFRSLLPKAVIEESPLP